MGLDCYSLFSDMIALVFHCEDRPYLLFSVQCSDSINPLHCEDMHYLLLSVQCCYSITPLSIVNVCLVCYSLFIAVIALHCEDVPCLLFSVQYFDKTKPVL